MDESTDTNTEFEQYQALVAQLASELKTVQTNVRTIMNYSPINFLYVSLVWNS